MRLSDSMARSSARIDLSRPTNSGITMCGNTTTSRSGRTGRSRISGWAVMGTPAGEASADDSRRQVKSGAMRPAQGYGDRVKAMQDAVPETKTPTMRRAFRINHLQLNRVAPASFAAGDLGRRRRGLVDQVGL